MKRPIGLHAVRPPSPGHDLARGVVFALAIGPPMAILGVGLDRFRGWVGWSWPVAWVSLLGGIIALVALISRLIPPKAATEPGPKAFEDDERPDRAGGVPLWDRQLDGEPRSRKQWLA